MGLHGDGEKNAIARSPNCLSFNLEKLLTRMNEKMFETWSTGATQTKADTIQNFDGPNYCFFPRNMQIFGLQSTFKTVLILVPYIVMGYGNKSFCRFNAVVVRFIKLLLTYGDFELVISKKLLDMQGPVQYMYFHKASHFQECSATQSETLGKMSQIYSKYIASLFYQ